MNNRVTVILIQSNFTTTNQVQGQASKTNANQHKGFWFRYCCRLVVCCEPEVVESPSFTVRVKRNSLQSNTEGSIRSQNSRVENRGYVETQDIANQETCGSKASYAAYTRRLIVADILQIVASVCVNQNCASERGIIRAVEQSTCIENVERDECTYGGALTRQVVLRQATHLFTEKSSDLRFTSRITERPPSITVVVITDALVTAITCDRKSKAVGDE